MLRVIGSVLLFALVVPLAKVEAGKTPKSLVKIGVLASLTIAAYINGILTVF